MELWSRPYHKNKNFPSCDRTDFTLLLDGCYTRLLRRVLNISWKKHPTIATLYGDLPRISTQVKRRRIQFAGHCARATDELVSSFVLWRHPSSLHRSRKLTFPDTLSRDTSIAKDDHLTAMTDRVYWRSVVNSISAEAERWWWYIL